MDRAALVGGRVVLPVGRYYTTDTLVVPSGVVLAGMGPGDDPRNVHYKGTRYKPFSSFNYTPMGVNSISFGSPHVRPIGRTCGAWPLNDNHEE